MQWDQLNFKNGRHHQITRLNVDILSLSFSRAAVILRFNDIIQLVYVSQWKQEKELVAEQLCMTHGHEMHFICSKKKKKCNFKNTS